MDERPKIIYFHGFGSSGATGTAQLLRRALPDFEIVSPDIPLDPAEALPFLRALCEEVQPEVVVGTSMGGMYAQQMYGFKRLLINPAFWMSRMSKFLKIGTFTYLNKRKDKQMQGRVTKEIIQRFRQMEDHQFDELEESNLNTCWALFGNHDTMVTKGRETFLDHYPEDHAQIFEGEHRVGDEVMKQVVVPQILDIFLA